MKIEFHFTANQPEYPGMPMPREIYRHTNGGLYQVLFVANLAVDRAEHPPEVAYVGENGHLWTRPLTDWARSMTKVASNGT